MRQAPALPPEAKEELRRALKAARTRNAVLRVLCVWLRASLRLNADQVATALGWSVAYVRRLQARYKRQGAAALQTRDRSGGRPRILSWRVEEELFRRLRREVWPASNLTFHYIHQEVEKAAGHAVSPDSVHRMLARRGWARRAAVMVPRQLPDAPSPGWSKARRSGMWSPVRSLSDDRQDPSSTAPGQAPPPLPWIEPT